MSSGVFLSADTHPALLYPVHLSSFPMPSALVPPEVWSRIFFFVAPPLPYVGLEGESFVEDAKGWRGERDERLYAWMRPWAGINQLMLVSKRLHVSASTPYLPRWSRTELLFVPTRLQELVSPIFWSYLVLGSSARAQRLVNMVGRRSRAERLLIYQKIRLVRVKKVGQGPLWVERSNEVEHPILAVLRQPTKATHVQLDTTAPTITPTPLLVSLALRLEGFAPLEGLTGLVLDRSNFDAATIALRHLAPSLRRLSVYALDGRPPTASADEPPAHIPSITFPALAHLATGTFGSVERWLPGVLAKKWRFPALNKLAVGPTPAHGLSVVDNDLWWFAADTVPGKKLSALYFGHVVDIADHFDVLKSTQVQELAIGFDGGKDIELDVDDFACDRKGSCDTIRTVIIVEGTTDRDDRDIQDACFIHLIDRDQMPSLEKVIWVSAEDPENGFSDNRWTAYVPFCVQAPRASTASNGPYLFNVVTGTPSSGLTN